MHTPAARSGSGADRMRVGRAEIAFLLSILFGATVGCEPGGDAPSGAATHSPSPMPVTLDLRDPAEARRWHSGPAIQSARATPEGLAIRALPGATRGRHLTRSLPLGIDRLGAIEIETEPAVDTLEVVTVIDGRPRTRQAVAAQPIAGAPGRLVARFRTGTWNRRPVDAIRIGLPPDVDAVALRRIRATTERYAPLPTAPPPLAERGSSSAPRIPTRRSVPSAPVNVILLLADTLRADRMSLYGAVRPTTPALDRLAASAAVFERAWSQAACTFPSVNSLLASRPTADFLGEPAHLVRDLEGRGALAERLRNAGYRTLAVSASWVVRATDSPHNDWGGGFDAGFDVFDESCAGEAAACVSRRGLELLDGTNEPTRPFLLYLHYLDPHDPYRPPPDHARRFVEHDVRSEDVRSGDPNRFAKDPAQALPRDVEHLRALYDEEVRYLDAQIGLLFAALEARDLLHRTIVVLASDHGEAFDEHATWKHCGSVHEEQIRTPLVFWVPGLTTGTRSGRAVENLDVLPTILDLLTLEGDAAFSTGPMAGQSLRDALDGDADATVPDLAFSSQGPWQAASDGRLKRIEHVVRDEAWLYDLAQDPAEQTPLVAPEPDAALADALAERFTGAAQRAQAWEAVARRLRALGYME